VEPDPQGGAGRTRGIAAGRESEMDPLLLPNFIRWVSILALLGMHMYVYLYGAMGGQRGRHMAIAYLAAFDWALMLGVTAGRTVAGVGTPFWSLHTVMWGALGVIALFAPAWLMLRFGLRWSGTLLLPVIPTDRTQRDQAGRTLRAYAWGFNYPFYREEDGELRRLVDSGVSPRGVMLGKAGPGFVIASSHYAIPLTVGTRNTQVGGHGIVFTERFERPCSPIDLRPQSRTKTVRALTRDGIPVRVGLTVVFQIDRRRARGNWLYPFDQEAVFAAVHAQGVSPGEEGEPEELGWEQIVVDPAVALLQDAIAQRLLDRLLEGEEDGQRPPREVLRDIVRGELAQTARPYGIQVMGIGLSNIEVEDEEVLKQRAESWGAGWARRRLEKEAQGEAEAIRLIEEARADAQRQMIVAITEAFQQLADAGTPVPAHVIALRFIDVLENVSASPPVHELLPETMQRLPGRLRLILEQAAAGTGSQTADKSEGSK